MKNSLNVKLYPCCSVTPEQTRLADAPISVPFPPRHVARAREYTKGGRGISKSEILFVLCCEEVKQIPRDIN